MSNLVPERVTDRFSSSAARPKLVRTYEHTNGWQKVEHPEVLTWDVVELLREQGVTRVELIWRFRRRELSLQRIGTPDYVRATD